jgi:hypothetical protein
MRLLVLALALSFTLTPMEARTKQISTRTATVRTVKAKARKNSKAPKARKAKRPARSSRNRAN